MLGRIPVGILHCYVMLRLNFLYNAPNNRHDVGEEIDIGGVSSLSYIPNIRSGLLEPRHTSQICADSFIYTSLQKSNIFHRP